MLLKRKLKEDSFEELLEEPLDCYAQDLARNVAKLLMADDRICTLFNVKDPPRNISKYYVETLNKEQKHDYCEIMYRLAVVIGICEYMMEKYGIPKKKIKEDIVAAKKYFC